MLVKVFEADTMSQALKKVKDALGPDALILSSRTVRKSGGLGLLSKPQVEITAAIESPATAEHQPVQQPAEPPRPQSNNKFHAVSEPAGIDYQQLWKQQRVIDPIESELRELRELVSHQNLTDLRSELDDLKAVLRQLNLQAPRQEASAPQSKPAPRKTTRSLDQGLELLTQNLMAHDIEADTAETLARYAEERLSPKQLANPALLDRFFIDTIADLVSFQDPLHNNGEQKRMALVGPTGVGKTTTIAKLAADFLHQRGGRVALVTIDTYRIAAVEQLKVYGEIMGLPVEVVYSPERLQDALDRHTDKDLILIDTTGRSPRDEQGLNELAAFLGPHAGIENHLVLATGTRGPELNDAVAGFARLPLSSLIFTKLDECLRRGALLDLPLRKNLPLSFLTNGQRVPEDLLMAEPNLVAGFIMGKH